MSCEECNLKVLGRNINRAKAVALLAAGLLLLVMFALAPTMVKEAQCKNECNARLSTLYNQCRVANPLFYEPLNTYTFNTTDD